jgi:hypothetical protein
MKITTITFMERKNKGNYEHEEFTASALVEEGEDFVAASLSLKLAVHNVLYGIVNFPIVKQEEVIQEEIKEAPKAKKAKKEVETKSEVELVNIPPVIPYIEQEMIPEVVKEPAKKPTGIPYNSAIPEHKSLFGGYLTKKYQDAWKKVAPAEEIKAFTSSLNGQNFIDGKGQIVPSFIEQIHTFFGA